MKKLLKIGIFVSILATNFAYNIYADVEPAPTGLRVDLIEHTDHVWKGGYLVPIPLEDAIQNNDYQFVSIQSKIPLFSWELQSKKDNVLQTAYQIRVASELKLLADNMPDMWDSGKIENDELPYALYGGKDLKQGNIYYWQVRSWNNGVESQWSSPKPYIMSKNLNKDYVIARYPIQKENEFPESIMEINSENSTLYLADFGKAAFATLSLTLTSDINNKHAILRIGEALKDRRVDKNPGGTIRYASYDIKLLKGTHTYQIKIRADKRNTGNQAIKMPDYIGEVFPFRYCEIESDAIGFKLENLVRESSFSLFNDMSAFSSDNKILNDIWELCRYSIKMTSFCGVYVDGDRERIPYEADALINQLSHYAVDNEYSLGRYSQEYLINHPTWPTEWILQSVLLAWNDYLYTGDNRSLKTYYNDLKAKILLPLADEQTYLISTRTGKQTPELMRAIHFNGANIRDIVDWPQGGAFGQDSKPGESDYFVFRDVNTVVNAYHYRALYLMSQIANAIGESADAAFYAERADKVKTNFNSLLFNGSNGSYRDGVGTDHSALHSSMFPLAFNMVPEEHIESVMKFIRSRKMACSVYGSQFLMDAIYEANDDQYGLDRLTALDDRGWYNMIRLGSTVTLEAWDNKYKNNLDWNHAWGSAPANIIIRKLVGVEPIEPGFKKVRIKPQLGNLNWIDAEVPSIRGTIGIHADRSVQGTFDLNLIIPPGVIAEVWLPCSDNNDNQIYLNGNNVINAKKIGAFYVFDKVGSGIKKISIHND